MMMTRKCWECDMTKNEDEFPQKQLRSTNPMCVVCQNARRDAAVGADTEPPRRLRRAERIMRLRTDRFLVVLEESFDCRNEAAVLRTCESMGVQTVWLAQTYEAIKNSKDHDSIHKGAAKWLTIRRFPSTTECIDALREDNREIWCTDLSPEAVEFNTSDFMGQVPPRLAVVFGRESDGVSKEFLEKCDKRVYLPMRGFTESYNLSVSVALTLEKLFTAAPDAIGDMSDTQRKEVRAFYYKQMATNPTMKAKVERWSKVDVEPLEDIRTPTAHRIPRIPRKLRKKMESDGYRPVSPTRMAPTTQQ